MLGEFAASASEGVIPLAWVEAANERWLAWAESGEEALALTCLGVDVARSGTDESICVPRHCDIVTGLRETSVSDTMDLTGQVAGLLRAQDGCAAVDVIDIGAGVVDRLREQGLEVLAFNASEATDLLDSSGELGFANCRSAAWWTLREFLDPANDCQIALPPNDQLTGDLTAPSWRATSAGRIQVESKEQIRKRRGHSTDYGDAFIQSFWMPPPVEETHTRTTTESRPSEELRCA